MARSTTFVPRDAVVAKRVLVAFTGVATSVTIVLSLVNLSDQPWGLGGALVALVVVGVFAAIPEPPAWAWTVVPVAATVLIATLDLATVDASVSAQMFFVFPALYAGAQLGRVAAVSLCGLSVVLDIVVNSVLLPAGQALINVVAVTGVLTMATGTLLLGAERISVLMSELHERAAVDSLTGLVTRRVLDDTAAASLQSAGNDGGTALIIVDIDHFKSVNDNYGHPTGDIVLQRVSSALRLNTRRADTVSRMGGDELAILIPGCSLRDAMRVAETILVEIRGLVFDLPSSSSGEQPCFGITASIGVAHLPTHASAVGDLYRAADTALYEAKHSGRDRVSVVNSGIGTGR